MGEDEYKVVAFTGHRPQKLPFGFDETDPRCINIKNFLNHLFRKFINKGFTRFLNGMAVSCDVWAAEEVIKFKNEGLRISLECIFPFKGCYYKCPQEWKDRIRAIRNRASDTLFLEDEYSSGVYFRRDKYLVDSANALIGIYNENLDHSGTGYTIEYGIKSKIPVIFADPEDITRVTLHNI